ncbi:MAG: sigma-70 family RNA polymerase sigma factor [Planctomycetes bacterium]|nr:sigma-70 family RNA polymerase sigma factor [Planctomycetota bacterium]
MSSMPAANSIELLRRIQSGDQQAWDELYLRYRDRLLFSIRCQLGSALRQRLQSEDVLHSVVREALGSLQRFEASDEKALGRYLHQCVLNKVRKKGNFFLAQRRAGDVPLSHSLLERLPASGPGCYLDHDRYAALEQAVDRLPEPMREVVLLRGVQGLSNREAAVAIGKSAEATSKIYQRAIARLGVALGALQ